MPTAPTPTLDEVQVLNSIARRALAWTVRMIHGANHRNDVVPGDPKVGGHPASCASALHIATALHLVHRTGADFFCAKPHQAPLDHALHHALGFFRHPDGNWFVAEEAEAVMDRLRSFSQSGEAVFQSYHAESDPDSWRTLPSGTVGIPPVNAGYLALAFRYAVDHGWSTDIPKHFWCVIGDSELREGSLMEAAPDIAERELGNVTWIVDYNRQNLDGTRIPNPKGLQATDADRIQRNFESNGWKVLQLRHGPIRSALFARPGGEIYQEVLERSFSDYEYQGLLWKNDAAILRTSLLEHEVKLKPFLAGVQDQELLDSFADLGGHDLSALLPAFEEARRDEKVPVLILAHTVKGWGLDCAAAPGNHSSLPNENEVKALLAAEGLTEERPFDLQGNWASDGPEINFLNQRGNSLRTEVADVETRIASNRGAVQSHIQKGIPVPPSLGIDTSLVPLAHTQWVWGQVAGKLVRIGTHDELAAAGQDPGKELTELEEKWAGLADLVLTLSPDVGTSTNIQPAMDEKTYGPGGERNLEEEWDLNERGRPQLFEHTNPWTRHIRFEIAEANCMSAAGSFGKMDQFAGVPLLPMMTVYDFFIKRALDQLYYNVYWRSSFLLIGTPSGVSLAPEGAQHSWKSDIQMPSLINWEPAYAQEMEWILADAMRRHFEDDNKDREGVLVRATTRGISQKDFLKRLKARPASAGLSKDDLLKEVRLDVLAGGYTLVDRSADSDYEPGDNVVDILAMGALLPEALAASEQLSEKGIQANVHVVTSPDLLLGRFAARNRWSQLKKLGLRGELQLAAAGGTALNSAEAPTLAARFVPLVSVADGETGLLDNAGSVIGVPQVALGIEKFSKSGTPTDIYRYHGLDADSIAKACQEALQRATDREARFRTS